jgi:hypothetical protein
MSTLYDISQRYMAIEALLDDESVPQEDINAALAEIKDEHVHALRDRDECLFQIRRGDGVQAAFQRNLKRASVSVD